MVLVLNLGNTDLILPRKKLICSGEDGLQESSQQRGKNKLRRVKENKKLWFRGLLGYLLLQWS